MTNEHISLALQYLDDDLLLQAETLPTQTSGGLSMKKRLTVLIVAALIATLCCATAFAAVSGGWFADVKNSSGAITGTEYHNATEEITVTAEAADGSLNVSVTFLSPDQFPYREIEAVGIGAYTIANQNGSIEAVSVVNGTAELTVPLGDLPAGDYTLSITEFVGEKKAEQPLPIYGDWHCSFSVQ